MEENNTIFTHAKMEYTSQLIDNISPHLFDGMKSIYDESNLYHKSHPNKSILVIFRSFLEKIPSWSNEIIENETDRIIEVSKCDWLDDLITAVFISHTKILTSIGSNINANIDLIIPKTINFIHKCYINIAREIWKNPYLFDDNLLGSDYQKNVRTTELLIKESIENTIRKLLPVKEILRQHLDTYETNNNEIKKRNNTNEIRELLLNELKNLSILSSDQKKVEEENSTTDEEDNNDSPKENNITIKEDEFKEGEVKEDEVKEGEVKEDEVKEGEVKEDEVKEDEVKEENIEPVNIDKIDDTGYESPDEGKIKEQCEGLNINDIPDITEENYDNVDIINNEEQKVDKNKILSNFMNSIDLDEVDEVKEKIDEVKEKIDEVKEDEVKEDEVKESSFSIPGFDTIQELNSIKSLPKLTEFNNIVKNKEKQVPHPQPEPEPEPEPVHAPEPEIKVIKNNDIGTKEPEIKKEEKEIISILKDDIPDDAQTIDNFFDDVSSLMAKKNISVNRDINKYTLFDDAIDTIYEQ